jgi:hypothetical protein
MAAIPCRNCGTPPGQGEYCPGCGQRNRHGALRLREIAGDVLEQVVEWRLPWPRTVLDLMWRPGAVALEYVEGRRARYVNPVKYCFILVAIVMAIEGGSTVRDPYLVDLPGNLLALLSVPLQVALLRTMFWRSRHTGTEIAVLCLFVTGQIVLLFMLANALFDALPLPDDSHLAFLFVAPVLGLFSVNTVAAIKDFFATNLAAAIGAFAIGTPLVLLAVELVDVLLEDGEVPYFVRYLFAG